MLSLIVCSAAFTSPAAPYRARGGAIPSIRMDPARLPPQKKGAIPNEVLSKIRLARATVRTVGDEDEAEQLWQAFKRCYPSEKVAIEAAFKNSNVFNPAFNSPTKIKGTYALLVERFGRADAQAIILQNPGVLICSPLSLKNESDDSIRKAAALIEKLDANKPILRVVARTTGVILLCLIVYGLVSAQIDPETGVKYGANWPAEYIEKVSRMNGIS